MKTGDTAKYGLRPIWLVRGENRHPGNDFRIGHDPLEDLDRMVADRPPGVQSNSPRAPGPR